MIFKREIQNRQSHFAYKQVIKHKKKNRNLIHKRKYTKINWGGSLKYYKVYKLYRFVIKTKIIYRIIRYSQSVIIYKNETSLGFGQLVSIAYVNLNSN